jgi:uridine phosphorylase
MNRIENNLTTMQAEYPLLEFDATPEAIIEPAKILKYRDMPERCVICFFQEVVEKVRTDHDVKSLPPLISEMGDHPLFTMEYKGNTLAMLHSGVGAPLAAAMLEEVIARGGRKFIACGGAGVLKQEIVAGHLIVPTSAVRDEGTSYHYVPPAREIEVRPDVIKAIESVLQEHHGPYLLGKTWTTDAVYRETPKKVQLRKSEGCLTVEMEAAAFFAVAQFRNVSFGQILYAGDDVSGIEWDSRDWQKQVSIREQVFWLSVEACLKL